MWKIQLTKTINFICSKDNDEKHVMHSKSDNIEIMIYNKTDEDIGNFLNHFLINIRFDWKNQRKLVILSLIVFMNCIIKVMK